MAATMRTSERTTPPSLVDSIMMKYVYVCSRLKAKILKYNSTGSRWQGQSSVNCCDNMLRHMQK